MLLVEDKAVVLYPIDNTDLIESADWVKSKPDGLLLRLNRVSGRCLVIHNRTTYENFQQLKNMQEFNFPGLKRIDECFISYPIKKHICKMLRIKLTYQHHYVPTIWKQKEGDKGNERTPQLYV